MLPGVSEQSEPTILVLQLNVIRLYGLPDGSELIKEL